MSKKERTRAYLLEIALQSEYCREPLGLESVDTYMMRVGERQLCIDAWHNKPLRKQRGGSTKLPEVYCGILEREYGRKHGKRDIEQYQLGYNCLLDQARDKS